VKSLSTKILGNGEKKGASSCNVTASYPSHSGSTNEIIAKLTNTGQELPVFYFAKHQKAVTFKEFDF
jgi:hypothetical protein